MFHKLKELLKGLLRIKRVQRRFSYTTDFYFLGKKLFTQNKIYGENIYMVLKNDIIEKTMSSLYSLLNNNVNHHFKSYQGIHKGKKVVLLAAGPSLNDYIPIKDAIHIGVNKLVRYDKVKLDYYFCADNNAIKLYGIFNDIKQLRCKKFIGFSPLHSPGDMASLQEAMELGAERFLCMEYMDPHFIPMDISIHPLCAYSSIVFPALHFACFTEPEELYLVGCDCSKNGHFDASNADDQAKGINPSSIISEWETLKSFLELRYPSTKIYSINPVGLKGMFNDIYQ